MGVWVCVWVGVGVGLGVWVGDVCVCVLVEKVLIHDASRSADPTCGFVC